MTGSSIVHTTQHGTLKGGIDSELNSAPEIKTSDINGHAPLPGVATIPASGKSRDDITGRVENEVILFLNGDVNDARSKEAATNGCVSEVEMEGVEMEGAVDTTDVKKEESGGGRSTERSMNGRLEMIQEDCDMDVIPTQPGQFSTSYCRLSINLL